RRSWTSRNRPSRPAPPGSSGTRRCSCRTELDPPPDASNARIALKRGSRGPAGPNPPPQGGREIGPGLTLAKPVGSSVRSSAAASAWCHPASARRTFRDSWVDFANNARIFLRLHARGELAPADPDGDMRIGHRFLIPATLLAIGRPDVYAVFGRHDPDGGPMQGRLRIAPCLDVDLVAFGQLP